MLQGSEEVIEGVHFLMFFFVIIYFFVLIFSLIVMRVVVSRRFKKFEQIGSFDKTNKIDSAITPSYHNTSD